MATRQQCADLVRQLGALGALTRRLGRALPPDCPPALLAVLGLLAASGQTRMGRLAEQLDVDLSVTSRHIAHLQARGWVDRRPDPQDRRSRLLCLTPRGEAALRAARERIVATLTEALGTWTDEEVRQLAALLARLHGSLADCPHPAGRPCALAAASARGAPHRVPEGGGRPDGSRDRAVGAQGAR